MTLTSCHDDETRALPPGVVTHERSSLGLLVNLVREPLAALPAACTEARMVFARNFGRQRVYLCDPELIHEALVRNAAALEKSVEMKRVLGVAVGDGLLTSDGRHWRRQRQAIAPTFRHERLAAFLPVMLAAAEATRRRWESLPPDATIDLGHEMMHTTFDIILETMLSGRNGIDAARVERGVADYLAATSWMFALSLLKAPRWLPFPGKARAFAATRLMRRSVTEMVARRRAAGGTEGDLVAMLPAAVDPETGLGMSDDEIADNILTFVAAGHETTAVALGWTFALLDRHRDCAARVVDEIERVTGGGPLEPQHVAALVYTRQVVSEVMRLYPPAPIISRLVRRDIDLAGTTVRAGSVVFVPIRSVHRHAALWRDPERFDPERFTSAASEGRHRFAYLPFGAGPRTCVGAGFAMMEAVAILAVLVRAFALEAAEPMPEATMRVTLRPARPIHMRIRTRRRSATAAAVR